MFVMAASHAPLSRGTLVGGGLHRLCTRAPAVGPDMPRGWEPGMRCPSPSLSISLGPARRLLQDFHTQLLPAGQPPGKESGRCPGGKAVGIAGAGGWSFTHPKPGPQADLQSTETRNLFRAWLGPTTLTFMKHLQLACNSLPCPRPDRDPQARFLCTGRARQSAALGISGPSS